MDNGHVPSDHSIETLLNFSKKVLQFQSQADMEQTMNQFFPTLKHSELDESWFLKVLDQILQIPKESQKIVFKLISLADVHYYNLFDVLENRYRASSEYEEMKKQMKKTPGRFYTEIDDFEMWKANIQQKDFTTRPNPTLQFILNNVSIKLTDNSRFEGYRYDEFFSQLGVQSHVLINNTTMKEMLNIWETHQIRTSPPYVKINVKQPYATKEEFIQIISKIRVEYYGKDVTDDIIEILGVDSIDEIKRLLRKITKVIHDSGIYSVAFMYYLLLDKVNPEIQNEVLRWWDGEAEWYRVEIRDALTEKILAIGIENVENIEMVRSIHSHVKQTIEEYYLVLEWYFDIYNRAFINAYHCEVVSDQFYPHLNHWHGDKEVTKINLIEDINNTTTRLLELEKSILPDFEEFVLSTWTDIASMDEGAQMTIADLIGRFSSSKVNSVLKQLQQSDYSLVQFESGAPNKNGHTKNDIW